MKVKKIFLLRNNDLGDVLLATPLLHGLKKAFPDSKIAMGVGNWAKPLLKGNPDLDELISCNAPWHNKQNCRFPANSYRTFIEGLTYVLFSKEALLLTKKKFTHGIDVLGSRQGSWLLRRTGIPLRFGVNGYAGGDKWCHKSIDFKEDRNVAVSALGFLPLFGNSSNIPPKPRLFLSTAEKSFGQSIWESFDTPAKKIVIAPGCGFEEKGWGNVNYNRLVELILNKTDANISIVGDHSDISRISPSNFAHQNRLKSLCGKTTIRETASIIKYSDLVLSNSSVAMHLAASFCIATIVCLGEAYHSAKLHQKQWGSEKSVILGQEHGDNITSIPSPELVYQKLINVIYTKQN